MNSVKILTFGMMNLDENDKRNVKSIGEIEDVMLEIRKRHAIALYTEADDFKIQGLGKKYSTPDPREETLSRLYPKLLGELKRLGMIRKDFESLRPSANVLALREAVKNAVSAGFNFNPYINCSEFMCRMIRQLTNESYENWEGFLREDILDLAKSIREGVSAAKYDVISLRFGLDEQNFGVCADDDEIKRFFKWSSPGPVYQLAQDACRALYNDIVVKNKIKKFTIPINF